MSSLSLSIHTSSPDTHSITIKNATVPFLSTLRRIFLTDIPSLSIDLITITNNSSNMPNEMLCHRIGMIQLPFIKLKRECQCTVKCKDCSVILSLDKSAHKVMNINGNDLVCDMLDTSKLNGVITKLSERQSIKLEGIAKNGTAKDHSKFQAVNVCSFIKNNEKFSGLKVELAEHREVHEVLELGLQHLQEKINKLIREVDEKTKK